MYIQNSIIHHPTPHPYPCPIPQRRQTLTRYLTVCFVLQALSKAVKTVQSTKQFSHPANWGGWVLVGHDVRLASKVALMGHALSQILQAPTISRETMRVLLHLVSYAPGTISSVSSPINPKCCILRLFCLLLLLLPHNPRALCLFLCIVP